MPATSIIIELFYDIYFCNLGHGRHLVQQSSESDLRRRSTASLAASVTHLAALTGKHQ